MTSQEMNDDLDFERKISAYSIRQLMEYSLRETRALKKEYSSAKKIIDSNCKKIQLLSIALLSLIIILVTLGILDGFFLELFSGLI